MKRSWLLLLALFAPTAAARLYVGFPVTVSRLDGGNVTLGGVQLGNYTGLGRLGWRAQLETDYGVGGSSVAAGANLMVTFGNASTFYGGVGLGLVSSLESGQSDTAFYLEPVVGADFDTASTLSFFVEFTPRYYVGDGLALAGRGGINIHLGAPAAVVTATAAPSASVSAEDTTPAGEAPLYDEDGNRYLEPYDPVDE